MSLYQELKRRNVFRVAAAYSVAAWLLVQVAETIFPLFGFGDTPARIVVILLVIGFVPALIISWAFEITPEGLKRDSNVDRDVSIASNTGKQLDRIIIVVLVLAVAYFAVDKFVLDPQRDLDISESAAKAAAEEVREEARLNMFSDKSIAVLPFANRSEQKADEYFTDGMHDELLTRLSRISALKVISRTSVMKYRETEKSIPEIGTELSVATILEGGVQRSGDHVRINVQLIDARTDEHLWAEIYDRELTAENLFAIQSEISSVIAKSLEATLSPEERTRLYDLPTSSLEAYNHYLQGRQSMALRTREGLDGALDAFEKATEIDPGFALAWVGIADSVHLLFEIGAYDWGEHRERHRAAAEKALALNDQLGEAYTSMAFVYGEENEFDKQIAAFEKAIELSPNYAQAYHWYANSLRGADRPEKRLPLLYKAAQLDPLSSVIQINIAGELAELERADEAREVAERLLEMDPEFATAHRLISQLDRDSGRLASAVVHLRKALELDPGNGASLENLGMTYLALADFQSVENVLSQMQAALGVRSPIYARLSYWNLLGQENFQAAIGILEDLPEPLQASPPALWAYATAYLLSEQYELAADYAVRTWPFLADPALWQEHITDSQMRPCEFAGAIKEAGKPVGQDLLRLIIENFESRVASNEPSTHWSHDVMVCYLADGAYQKALDILDRESAEGRLIDAWWFQRMLPWWEPMEDNPRHLELVKRVEALLEEQRALVQELPQRTSGETPHN